jgi:hypothetical protein
MLQGYASWAAALTHGLSRHIEAATCVLLLCHNMLCVNVLQTVLLLCWLVVWCCSAALREVAGACKLGC